MSNTTQFTYNWPLLGNQSIVDFLQKSINNGKLAHFYIFAGPKDLGKSTLANFLASSLLCTNLVKGQGTLPCIECSHCQQFKTGTHSDIIIISRQEGKKNISINQVREFINRLHLGSFGGFYKIGIIKGAEELNIEAANALLKLLEEPKERVVIILLTSQLERLPTTVISRSQTLFFKPVASDIIYDYLINSQGASRDAAKNLSRLSAGRPALAVKFLQDKEFLNEYQETGKALLKVVDSGINEKFSIISDLLPSSKSGDAPSKAMQILEIWQIVLRDLLLMNFQLDELSVNNTMEQELKKVNLAVGDLVRINTKIGESKKYLAANVNPGLVLEELSISI